VIPRLSLGRRGAAARADAADLGGSVRDVARGSILLFVAQVVGNVGFFAAVLVLARALSPGERGTFAFITVTAFIATRITRIGVNEATMIFAAQQPERRPALLGNLIVWSTAGSALAGGLVALLFLALGSHRPAGMTALDCALVGVGIVCIAVFEAGNGFLTGCGWIRERASALLWAPWLYAALLAALAFTTGLTVGRAVVVWCAIHLAWAAGVWTPSIRRAGIARPSWPLFVESVRFGARAYVGTLSDFLNFRTDQLLLGFLATQAALGVYAVAVNASEVLLYLPDAVGMALLPYIARAGGARVRETLDTFRRLALITLLTLVAAALVAPPLLPLVFGREYDASVWPFLWLLPGALGFAALRVFSFGMLGSNAPGRSSIAPVVSLVVGLALDVALIPLLGANGAAIAASAAFLAGGAVSIVAFRTLHVFRLRDLVPRPGDLTPILGPVALRTFYPARGAVVRARSLAWAARPRRREDGIRFLFYHRVTDERDELAVRPARFRTQMEFLAGQGYRVVDVVTAAELLAGGEVPERTVALSFDDGFCDVAENAMPVLRELGFHATVFVSPDVVSGAASFDWYREQPPVLDWEEIVELDRAGTLRFEAHTLTHPHLPKIAEVDARREIAESRRVLAERLGRDVTVFCYPAGLFGARERTLVVEAGYRAAVSCEPGINRPGGDPFSLRRVQIDPRDRLLDFRAKAFGGHDAPPRARALYRRWRYGVAPYGLEMPGADADGAVAEA
jgi:O-antigen/teichoic acid export membrane protein/peptidoglycan/xylan/chitin deacetylase (PgdA/CDA1 family)